MKAKYCMYCGKKLKKEDKLESCCNKCNDIINDGY